MNDLDRRRFLKVLGAGAGAAFASVPLYRAFAGASGGEDEFFIFIHASGGWDVTLWADPAQRSQGTRRSGIHQRLHGHRHQTMGQRTARRKRVDLSAGSTRG